MLVITLNIFLTRPLKKRPISPQKIMSIDLKKPKLFGVLWFQALSGASSLQFINL